MYKEGQVAHKDTEADVLNFFWLLGRDHESTRSYKDGSFTSIDAVKRGQVWIHPANQTHGGPPNTSDTTCYLVFCAVGPHCTDINVHQIQE